ncbi:ras-related protein Rab-17 isoform X3 [Lithobates pipiens]
MEHDIISEERAVYTYKLVLLGSSGVGKSSIVVRYLRDEFRDTDCTTGCAFFTQRVYHQGKPLNFEIWDTAGQERYHSVCNLYYRGSSAALLVYDITSKDAQAFAEQEKLLYIETSAKTAEGVSHAFEAVASQLLIMDHHKQDKARRRDADIIMQGAQNTDGIHRCCNFQ